jgi:signal transduction histidine kinase
MAAPIEILLVDDEARNLDALEAILADPAYSLLRAENADRALRQLLDHDVAAIVLDIKMPGVSGLELAGMIKNTRRFRQTPIVFLTAYMLDDQHIVAGYGAGAVDYLAKPVNPAVLRHKVAVFADLFRKTRELAELNDKLEERVQARTEELARSEAALRKADTQKDEFLAVLAHELRNPLAPLRTGLDILLRRLKGAPEVDKTLAVMNRQLDHMVRLIDDLLDVSRISRGLLELKKADIALEDVIETAIDASRAFFAPKQQELSMDIGPGIRACIDATRVAQILTNLLHNAAKFTPEGGRVTVSLTREGEQAVARIVDSGPGISSTDIGRIFDMFARLEPAQGGESGLGIGLALARRLAEMHGGTLEASSAGKGAGSTLTLRLPALPVSEGTTGDQAKPAAEDGETRSLKILVIEDNPDVSDVLVEWLEDIGHQLSFARSGERGLELIQERTPDVVLCDLGLAGMSGLDVCRAVRANTAVRQPVMVALTGWGREEDRRRTSDAGFDHHIVKPVAPEKLLALLRTAIN